MNFPAVPAGDPEVSVKIAAARRRSLPVDGHAPPSPSGEAVRRYAAAGIHTDHECTSLEEAEDKLAAGMKIFIREGSAARNFDSLQPLIDQIPTASCSVVTISTRMNWLPATSIASWHGCWLPVTICSMCCARLLNPIEYYGLSLSRQQVGGAFEGVLLADVCDCRPLATWLKGVRVAETGRSLLAPVLVVASHHLFESIEGVQNYATD